MKKYQKIINYVLVSGLILSPLSVHASMKTENVYTTLNESGSQTKTMISNHLSWVNKETLKDDSELRNILNISGEETFEKKENLLTWNALGKDIFYQGTTEKELPIKTTIKYYLEDEEKEMKDIIGKSGNVKIKINFENTLKNLVQINGKNTELYTPFVTTIGTMIDAKNNTNLKINNGKIISTGTRNMVIGIASPGLYESLNLKEFQKLNEITIEFVTTNFNLNSIYIISTPKILEDTDLKIFEKMDELYNNMYELQKNMDKLEAGTKELEIGASNLVNGSNELQKGIFNATIAIEKLKQGSNSLDNGLKEIITSLENAKKELSNTNINTSLNDLNTLKNQNKNTYQALIKKTGLDENTLASTYTQYNLKDYTGNDEKLLALKSTYEMTLLLKSNNKAIDNTITTLQGINLKLLTLLENLNNAIKATEHGSKNLTNGLEELKAGMTKLQKGSTALTNGTNDLYQGTINLKNGTTTLNQQGIKKLNNYVNVLKNYSNKTEALLELSKNYKGFTSKNSNTTNFISIVKPTKITYKR